MVGTTTMGAMTWDTVVVAVEAVGGQAMPLHSTGATQTCT